MYVSVSALLAWGSLLGLSQAACPYAHPAALGRREDAKSPDFLNDFKVDDSKGYMTSDVGGPIEDQFSLKAGIRGSTLLEDFIFRQKIQHFDHERVSPCGAVREQLRCVFAEILTWLTRFPKGRSMRVAQEHMAPSPAMVTLVTSPRRHSWAPPARRPRYLSASLPSPAPGAARTPPEMFTALLPGCKSDH